MADTMMKLKNKRVILTSDFNSTETKSSNNSGGPLPQLTLKIQTQQPS
jgi:hypothetical protein